MAARNCTVWRQRRRDRPRRHASRGGEGFTLLELVVVLVIMALVAVGAPALVGKLYPATQVKGAAHDIAAGLRAARNQAITYNREATLTLDLANGVYRVDREATARRLPAGLTVAFLTAQSEQIDDASARIRFFPDGSSTGGRIRLGHGARQHDVTVDWLTGRVMVAE